MFSGPVAPYRWSPQTPGPPKPGNKGNRLNFARGKGMLGPILFRSLITPSLDPQTIGSRWQTSMANRTFSFPSMSSIAPQTSMLERSKSFTATVSKARKIKPPRSSKPLVDRSITPLKRERDFSERSISTSAYRCV